MRIIFAAQVKNRSIKDQSRDLHEVYSQKNCTLLLRIINNTKGKQIKKSLLITHGFQL